MSNFHVDITSITDYYAFGAPMRHGESDGGYRWGFQGQEQDPETGLVNYKYRMHDPRLGRFFAVDPLAGQYPYNSPYAFSENRVIDAVELEGLEMVLADEVVGGSGTTAAERYDNRTLYPNVEMNGKKYIEIGANIYKKSYTDQNGNLTIQYITRPKGYEMSAYVDKGYEKLTTDESVYETWDKYKDKATTNIVFGLFNARQIMRHKGSSPSLEYAEKKLKRLDLEQRAYSIEGETDINMSKIFIYSMEAEDAYSIIMRESKAIPAANEIVPQISKLKVEMAAISTWHSSNSNFSKKLNGVDLLNFEGRIQNVREKLPTLLKKVNSRTVREQVKEDLYWIRQFANSIQVMTKNGSKLNNESRAISKTISNAGY